MDCLSSIREFRQRARHRQETLAIQAVNPIDRARAHIPKVSLSASRSQKENWNALLATNYSQPSPLVFFSVFFFPGVQMYVHVSQRHVRQNLTKEKGEVLHADVYIQKVARALSKEKNQR